MDGDGEMGWARLAFARFCTALLGGRRATTTSGLGRYPFAKMDLGKPQNTSTGTGPKGDEEEELEAGEATSRSISPSAKRTGTNLVRLGRRLACETAAKWVIAGWAQLAPRKKGRDAGVEAFSGRNMASSNRPAIRVMMRGGNVWCLHRVLAARGHAGREEQQLAERVCNVQTPRRAPPNKPRLHVENPGQQRHGMGRRGVQCDGISPPACSVRIRLPKEWFGLALDRCMVALAGATSRHRAGVEAIRRWRLRRRARIVPSTCNLGDCRRMESHLVASPRLGFPPFSFPQTKAQSGLADLPHGASGKLGSSRPGILNFGRVSGKNKGTRRIQGLSDTPYIYMFAICQIPVAFHCQFHTLQNVLSVLDMSKLRAAVPRGGAGQAPNRDVGRPAAVACNRGNFCRPFC